MPVGSSKAGTRYRAILRHELSSLPQIQALDADERLAMLAVSAVLPFRVNQYVIEELIDWDDIPDDPIYQLTFPQRAMLAPEDLLVMQDLVRRDAHPDELQAAARKIRYRLNPQPDGQKEYNVPCYQGEPIQGMQHKYHDTVLYFPRQGQTCHAFCTYCFRWAQFIGEKDLRFRSSDTERFHAYLCEHRKVRDLLFTGGDPMVMRSKHLRAYIEPLLGPGFEHVQHIRIGTKAIAWWPYRFVHGEEADDFLRLLEEIRAAGKLPAIMGHFSHPVELSTDIARRAIRRIQSAGGVIRTQAPLVRHVNDSSSVWEELWNTQVTLGCIPYYMFVARDTGPREFFRVPLARALRIYQRAYRKVSGLARTVRGPVMSALPGKALVTGVAELHGKRFFSLQLIRGRKPSWERRPFHARYDEEAAWLTDLKPAFGEREFFYWMELQQLLEPGQDRNWLKISNEYVGNHPDPHELQSRLENR
ncbi:KamA family radical SAM protein [Candidatus Zixiibacteriota bacterium]